MYTMVRRYQLQAILEDILGSTNVYFQPPATTAMKYPCIVYEREYINTDFADNRPYSHRDRYQVTVIDRKPDSTIVDRVKMLPMCTFNRYFASDNLNHNVFTMYF